MPRLDHERYCSEIAAEATRFRDALREADLTARVPTCPDWDLRGLAVHVGRAHRWMAEIVRTGAREELPDEAVPGYAGPGEDAALDAWFAAGAELLTAALRESGPDAPVWTWSRERRAGFWARRMTHESVVHRADAAAATGAAFAVGPEVAADAIDEWLEILDFYQSDPDDADLAALRAPDAVGRSLRLHAADAPMEPPAGWLIELGAEGFTWRRAPAPEQPPAAGGVAVRGPLTDLLLVLYRRLPPPEAARVEVRGDATVLDLWLERTSWG